MREIRIPPSPPQYSIWSKYIDAALIVALVTLQTSSSIYIPGNTLNPVVVCVCVCQCV